MQRNITQEVMDTHSYVKKDGNKVEHFAIHHVTTTPKAMDQFAGEVVQQEHSNVELSA